MLQNEVKTGTFCKPPIVNLSVEIQMMISPQNRFKVVRRVGSLSNHDDKADEKNELHVIKLSQN